MMIGKIIVGRILGLFVSIVTTTTGVTLGERNHNLELKD
jgi:hypothetical protein